MAISAPDFLVFNRYEGAEAHAFVRGIVSEEDKDRYFEIFQLLRSSVANAMARSPSPDTLDDWSCRFHRNGGVQGQRPVDLWASIINKDSDAFSRFPQIYVIASVKGIELGFSVSIHEADYYNEILKRRNRAIIPIINSKLPAVDSAIVASIDQALLRTGADWKYGEKARQGSVSTFNSFAGVIAHLKSGQSSPRGGGSVFRILSFEEAAARPTSVEDAILEVLEIFWPVMQMLRPVGAEVGYAENLFELADAAEAIGRFDPDDEGEGKKKILREVAVRLGQPKFRDELVQAYGGKCAVSGCAILQILQAAHISPYNGARTNHVTNGILLRADIHTLFDLGLIRIDPDTRILSIASPLLGTEYEQFTGQRIADPAKSSQWPLKAALAKKIEMFPSI